MALPVLYVLLARPDLCILRALPLVRCMAYLLFEYASLMCY